MSKLSVFWIFAIIAAIILLVFMFQKPEAGSILTIRMYDSNGYLIKESSSFSIVNSVPGVSSIDLTVTLTNIGNQALTCNIVSLSPTAFDSAMTKTIKTLPVNQKVAWTSSLISVAPLESTIPVTFSATMKCSYVSGTTTIDLSNKVGTLSVNIQSETASPAYTLSLITGGVGTEYCGDGICQSSETTTSCPADCTVAAYVKFRTSDLSYVSGSSVAYSSSCGSVLTRYGYSSVMSSSGYNCDKLITDAQTRCGGGTVSYLFDVPSQNIFGSSAYGIAKVYNGTADATKICVCATETDGAGYKFSYYSSSITGTVDSSATTIDSSKEVSC